MRDVAWRHVSAPTWISAQRTSRRGGHVSAFVRPAGRTYLQVKVLYIPGKGKC